MQHGVVRQEEQRGTGHAVAQARAALEGVAGAMFPERARTWPNWERIQNEHLHSPQEGPGRPPRRRSRTASEQIPVRCTSERTNPQLAHHLT